MNDGGGDGTGCCGIKVRMDKAKFTNMTIIRFGPDIISDWRKVQ